MAAIVGSDLYPTLYDVASRTDPNGAIAGIAEIMTKTDEVLEDVPFVEATDASTHETTARTGIPAGTWRSYYGFVQPTKSTTVRIRDSMGMLEQYGEVDKALADRQNNAAAFITTENKAKIIGMAHDLGSAIWYANEKITPSKFTGLAPRFNSLSTATAKSAANVISAAGSSNCTSIWIINWGEETIHGIYPRGSTGAGLQMEDLGAETKVDANGGLNRVYRQHFKQTYGLSVRDWRHAVRICNIDVTALTFDAATGANLYNLITRGLELIEGTDGRAGIYCNRRVRSFLRQQSVQAVKQSTLTVETLNGKRVVMLDEYPVRRCDSILNTEAPVA